MPVVDAPPDDHAAVAAAFSSTSWPGQLRRQQREALDVLETTWASGSQRAWLALPPGAGKTLVGLEAARRLGRPTVILGPNTAIQAQWIDQWSAFRPATVRASADRSLRTPITALTYQSLAVFDPDAEVDEEGHLTVEDGGPSRGAQLLDRLHTNGRAMVGALHDAGPITLVLDEAHHLLEVWGALLAELLDQLPDAHVVGLTATPPTTLTRDQADLVDRLFGHPIYQASVPGLVRDGYLAPFAELAWLTTPTTSESRWLGAEAERFAELCTDLLEPGFASIGLFDWLDRRFVSRSGEHGSKVSWARLEKTRPELASAVLRLHSGGLVPLPPGARVREEHRREPAGDDWVAVLDDFVRHFLGRSAEPRDQAALEKVRQALPSLGYRLTKRGIRAGRSPVDRVLARSEAKTHGAVEIAAWEAATLGDRLRTLVLCDHERASATLPARLVGVLDAEAGSARLVLENLVADERTAILCPMMVTGRTVAAAASTARAFAAWVGSEVELDPIGPDATGVVEISGRWSSRTWVPLLTRYFEDGHCQVLVGTRGLLGEGWNAPSVNTLIDLTTATTPTAVVQTRGRALRTDPDWPDKVATNWSVVCVSDDHPGGEADWGRFVRKHAGYLAVDKSGEIIDGVAHVDDHFSPYKPPPATEFDALNAEMLDRSSRLSEIRESWRIGEAYDDRFIHELRVVRDGQTRSPAGTLATPDNPVEPPSYVPAEYGVVRAAPLDGRPQHRFHGLKGSEFAVPGYPVVLAVAITFTLAVVGGVTGAFPGWIFGLLVLPATIASWIMTFRSAHAEAVGKLLIEAAGQPPDLGAMARAVADGLFLAGLCPVGADAVRVDIDHDGTYRAMLTGVSVEQSREFVSALDDVLSTVGSPRYVIPRYEVPLPAKPRRAGRAVLRRKSAPNPVAYHAVPTVLGANGKRAAAFERAWARWVSGGTALYTGSPEGAGILAAQRGLDPFAATTLLRVAWT